jgi:hypothetical protein
MEHNQIVEKDIIEQYITGKLQESEAVDFEEHMLFCKKCRDTLSEMEIILKSIQINPQVEKSKPNKYLTFYKYSSIAASILFAFSIFWVFNYKSAYNKSLSDARKIQSTMQDSLRKLIENSKDIKPQPTENDANNINIDKKPVLIADNFASNKNLERYIGQDVRGDNFKLLSKFIPGTVKNSITLNWETQEIVNVRVFDNQQKTVIKFHNPKPPLSINHKFENGKYYLCFLSKEGNTLFVTSFLSINNQIIY